MAEITIREALAQALREALQRDDRVFLMGEDIGAYGGSYAVTRGMLEEFGQERVRDTPISESAVVGAGIGAAMAGMRPVIELMTINFSLLAMDQIVNNAAKIRYMSGGQVSVPLVIRMAGGGGAQLGAQHSQNLEAWFAHVPGLKVVCPATPYDAKGLLHSAIADSNPVLFVEHALLYNLRGEVPEGDYTVPLGVSEVKREGRDVTIVSYSRMLQVALRAAEQLAGEGIETEVVDLRTLRPADLKPVVESVRKTNHLVVAEEAWKLGGFMGEVASQVMVEAFDYLDAPVGWVSGPEVPMPYAKNLEQAAIPNQLHLVTAVHQALGRA